MKEFLLDLLTFSQFILAFVGITFLGLSFYYFKFVEGKEV